MDRLTRFKLIVGLIILSLGLGIVILHFFFDFPIILPLLVFAILSFIIYLVFYFLLKWKRDNDDHVEDSLNTTLKDALRVSNVGIIVYDDNYEITWMSRLFSEYNINQRKEKLLGWLPELQDLISGDRDIITVILENNHKYEVTKKENSSVLLFKDITKQYDLEKKYHEEMIVFGLVNFDNYDEAAESEEDISIINSEIKLPVFEYLRKHNVAFKTLRNNRIFLILTEKVYEELAHDRFSIINLVRRESKKLELPITLSMAFARGTEDLRELDEMASNLLDLAQTRGGDQVVVRKLNEEPIYFGGSSEAREKSSKVRVRVMANSIRDLIVRSSNVIIVGHEDMDADCVGSAIAMSSIAQSFKKNTIIVAKTGGVEPMINDVMNRYREELELRHRFVTINEAINHLDDNSLVIMVDHHSASQSNGKELLKSAKRIVIVDHHRRKADLDVDAMLVYIEASASSTCELMCEFLPYLSGRVSITPIEANIMYLGMLIDTNRFRVRTGARTFDVCCLLKQYGADMALVEELNEEPYDMILSRSKIIEKSKRYEGNVILSVIEDGIYPRSIISQASDTMLQTKGVKAVFVIAPIAKDEIAISARSKGGFNVQVIMEKMHGGGHMTAAGAQIRNGNVDELKNKLLTEINAYIKGVQ